MRPTVVILTGCTASGKSAAVAMLPANAPLVIINADSRQIYRETKIGTAMPSEEEFSRFPHRLFAFLSVTERYSAGRFQKEARQAIEAAHLEGRIPLIIGGTFFYIKSLLDGIAEQVTIPEEITDEAAQLEIGELKSALAALDPGFDQEKTSDRRRLERAYSFSKASGRPFSQAPKTGGIGEHYNIELFQLEMTRAEVYERINARTLKMFENGLLDEAIPLIQQHGPCPGLDTIGYKEISACLQSGANPYDQQKMLIDQVAQNTRRFAKRQMTWFQSEGRIKRFDHASFLNLLDIK